jgi:hypothetical protein
MEVSESVIESLLWDKHDADQYRRWYREEQIKAQDAHERLKALHQQALGAQAGAGAAHIEAKLATATTPAIRDAERWKKVLQGAYLKIPLGEMAFVDSWMATDV